MKPPANRKPYNKTHFQKKQNHSEPIAIIGLGCRFPGGADNPKKFWHLLRTGTDAITTVPEDRWHLQSFFDIDASKPAKMYTRRGGFIKNIDQFDALFFGMSPREAARVDPQHRILMEVSYEALEDAGIQSKQLAGTDTGVFVGIAMIDYAGIQLSPTERSSINAYTNLGLAMCIAANRLSYLFDLHGPSLAVDTACSSSLVATHLACQSIWQGECEMALVGGVNLIIRPEGTIGFSKASMLSADGHCRSFDAEANGYVRSEGAGAVILKPLSRALADRDLIYALVHGTLVNQDGRTTGISLPNREAQEEMLRRVYHQTGIDPRQIHYIEAHGTGTPAGDPIELNAIGNIVSKNRREGQDCLVGSVKANIGHLEAASGIAGLIKTALAIRHGQIPPNIHFKTPNPDVPFAELKLRVPTEMEPWPGGNELPRLAGVNSFGFGGTNAHLILGEAPPVSRLRKARRNVKNEQGLLVPLSARSSGALLELAISYLTFLKEEREIELEDLAYSASLRRSHHDYRLALAVESKKELADALEAYIADETRPGISTGRQISGRLPRLIFVFSGMGPQWWAMGRELIENEPVFQEKIRQCDQILQKYSGWSLWDQLTATESASRINETQIAQPAIFSLQVALAALWLSWGVKPDAVVGHSIGEVAAAHIAGALSLEDALKITYHRSRLQQKTAGQGTMLAVGLSPAEARIMLPAYKDRISIAAVNSPADLTLSGEKAALEEIAEALGEKLIFNRTLQVEVPYHSFFMDPLREEFLASVSGIEPREAAIPFFSTALSRLVEGQDLKALYWWHNIRNPVHFAAAVEEMAHDEDNIFLEISAHPVLSTSISKCLSEAGKEGAVLPSLRRREAERLSLLASLGRLYTSGYPVDWKKQYPQGGNFVRFPSYPWQRERQWNESEKTRNIRQGRQVHPLLGTQLDAAHAIWSVELEKQSLPYLNDHRIQDTVIYPAAGYIEMALAAARSSFGPGSYVLEDVVLQRAIFFADGTPQSIQLIRDLGQPSFDIYSHTNGSEQTWNRHASGKLRRLENSTEAQKIAFRDLRSRFKQEIAADAFYSSFKQIGLQYGPCFRGVKQLWVNAGESLGHIRLHHSLENEAAAYLLHPTILDACLQVLFGALFQANPPRDGSNGVYLPVQLKRILFYKHPGNEIYSHARLTEREPSHIKGDFTLFDSEGNITAEIQGLVCRSIDNHAEDENNYLSRYRWVLKNRPGKALVPRCADFLPDPPQIAAPVTAEISTLTDQLDRDSYYDLALPQLNLLARAYIIDAFQKLGIEAGFAQSAFANVPQVEPGADLPAQGPLALLTNLLARTETSEKIEKYRAIDDLWQESWMLLPAHQAELALIRQGGKNLIPLLKGETGPEQLGESPDIMAYFDHFYGDSPAYRIYNRLIADIVTRALEHLPEECNLRILEIGDGAGSLAPHLLRRLPVEKTLYVLTNKDDLRLSHAEQKFQEHSSISHQLFDIEEDPLNQGFEPHSFDLIIAPEIMKSVSNISKALTNIRQLIASKGLLIFMEDPEAPTPADLIIDLLKKRPYLAGTNGDNPEPWLPPDQWKKNLEAAGFENIAFLTDRDEQKKADRLILLARGPSLEISGKGLSSPAPAAGSRPERWLVFGDNRGLGCQIKAGLESRGVLPVIIEPGSSYRQTGPDSFLIRPAHKEDLGQLIETVLAGPGPLRGIIHLWSLNAPLPEETNPENLQAAQLTGAINVLSLVQVLAEKDSIEPPQVCLVTAGAQQVISRDQPLAVAQSPLWGLNRVIVNEYPHLNCRLFDLSPESSPQEIAAFIEELWTDEQEDEIALRGNARYVNRLKPVCLEEFDQSFGKATAFADKQPFAVEISKPGVLNNLLLKEKQRKKPGPGEVEIEVCAVGLNFKDIMIAMGLLPSEALEGGFTGKALGMECSGKIVTLGEGVRGFAVGDEVLVSAPGALQTHLTVRSELVVLKPDKMGFEEGSTILIAYLTAYYALHHLGRIQPGERVLIHAATGGVGLAAIQLAQQAGAEIFATAGTPAKRELLQSLGIKYVMDSRSLSFADEVMKFTDNQGVDLILNSLAGEAIDKNLSILNAYGRFIEIGKRDIYENRKIGLRPFYNNLSLFTVDLDRLCAQRPALVQSFLAELLPAFKNGSLRPLPYRVFPVSEVASAFRYMAQGRHIGKVVISMQDPAAKIAPLPPNPWSLEKKGAYLVTGGTGGFGFEAAKWLVGHGAGNLALVSRSGNPSPAVKAEIESMRNRGINIEIFKADVSDQKELGAVLAAMKSSMPPLRGVIHAAMVIDDALLKDLNAERITGVMAPKVIGAWNLHLMTLKEPLDFFVAFSSYTTMIGNPGQGNYVAANAFLDALAHYRRQLGLPALTVNWGAVGDAGYVARNPDVRQKLEYHGVKPMPAGQLLKIMEKLLQHRAIQAGVGHLHWSHLAKNVQMIRIPPRLVSLVEAAPGDESRAPGSSLVEELLAVDPAERHTFLSLQIRDQLARILGVSPVKLDVEKPLLDLGLDSLMAVEIGNQIKVQMGIEVPAMKLMEGLSIEGLSGYIIEQLTAAVSPGEEFLSRQEAIARVEKLSDEEVDTLLQEMLAPDRPEPIPGEPAKD